MDRIDKLGERPRRVAVIRALRGLGDFLVAVPAFRALRAALPDAEITLVGLPAVRPLVQRFSSMTGDGNGSGADARHQRGYLDRLLEFPGFPGIPEVPFSAPEFKNWISSSPITGPQAGRFDLAIQMHGNGVVINSFAALLGASCVAGFYLPGFYCPDPDRFLVWPSTEPELWRLLRLVEFLGLPLKGDHIEFPLQAGDWEALAAIPEARELAPSQYAVLHPGAYEPSRRWPAENFARIADELSARGLLVVLSGTAAEIDATAAVARRTHYAVLNLAGRTTLGALAALLSQARLLVSNDTGVSHLAAALRVPSVIVFIASDPLRWAPADRRLHRPVSAVSPGGMFVSAPQGSEPCDRRCLRDACRCYTEGDGGGPKAPDVDAVLAETLSLLGEVTYAA